MQIGALVLRCDPLDTAIDDFDTVGFEASAEFFLKESGIVNPCTIMQTAISR